MLVTLLFLTMAVVAGGALFFNDLVRFAMTPSERFDPAALPAAPDYTQPASWSALPTREDAADAFVSALPAGDQSKAAADVFYVHPTTYVGSNWNGPIDSARLNADTDRVATRIQASAFNGCCAVYGPRYRQANGMAFTQPSEDGGRALDLAWTDVRAAFRHFVSTRDAQRPFIVASHSQGSALAYRLLREEIAATPLRNQLVAAYLIGGPITEEMVARELPQVPVCAAPDDVGCVLGWHARSAAYKPGPFEFRMLAADGSAVERPGARLCVNPLSWRHDNVAVAAEQNSGAVFLDADPPVLLPHFASGRCMDGTLVTELAGAVPRDLMGSLLDRALGAGNWHPVEFQLFFADIRRNAAVRLAAWQQHAPAN